MTTTAVHRWSRIERTSFNKNQLFRQQQGTHSRKASPRTLFNTAARQFIPPIFY
jgi:hypothetical protein